MKKILLLLLLFPFFCPGQVQWLIPVTGNYKLIEYNDTLLKTEYVLNADSSTSYKFSFIDGSGNIFNTSQDTVQAGPGNGTMPYRLLNSGNSFTVALNSVYNGSQTLNSIMNLKSDGTLNWNLSLDSSMWLLDMDYDQDTLYALVSDTVLKVLKYDLGGNMVASLVVRSQPFVFIYSTPVLKIRNSRIYIADYSLTCHDSQGNLLWTNYSDTRFINVEINSDNKCFASSYEVTGPVGMKWDFVKVNCFDQNGVPAFGYPFLNAGGYPFEFEGHSIALHQDSVWFAGPNTYFGSFDTTQFNSGSIVANFLVNKYCLKSNGNEFYIAKAQSTSAGNCVSEFYKYNNGNLILTHSETNPDTAFNLYVSPHSWGFYFGTSGNIGKYAVSGVGMTEVGNSKISIYPNPSNDMISINADREIDRVVVNNIAGIQVLKISGVSNFINIQNLSPGIYMLDIIFRDGSVSREKFIRE